MPRRLEFLALVLLLLGGGLPAAPSAADDPPPGATPGPAAVPAPTASETAPPDVPRLIEDLRSPAEQTRTRAVRDLRSALPASLEPVLGALAGAPPGVRRLLVDVLLADGSRPALTAALRTMEEADEVLAAQVRRRIASDERSAARVRDLWAAEPTLRLGPDGEPTARTRALEALLDRAEVERLFVSRKSRSGSTGSYHGQYAVLEPYRETALDLCQAILMDRAIPEPGVVPVGGFEFLRPPRVFVDVDELQGMAAHAFSELARPTDVGRILVLATFLHDLRTRLDELGGRSAADAAFADVLGRYADLLLALYLVRPEPFQGMLDAILERWEWDSDWRFWLTSTFRAFVWLRTGRHSEAIREFESLLEQDDWTGGAIRSPAATHYNLACAYAQWGEEVEEPLRGRLRERALDHLTTAIDERWSDVGWMEEDRDLEPLRDLPRYRALLQRVRRELDPHGGK